MSKQSAIKSWLQRLVYIVIAWWFSLCTPSTPGVDKERGGQVVEALNKSEIEVGRKTIAIVGATIIDGNGGAPIEDGIVLVKGDRIDAVGTAASVVIPKYAEIIDGKGLSILPGLIDSHFHLDNMHGLPALFLKHGVTSVRDPGAWNQAYESERKSDAMIPRLFLCGPHLDMYPPAYPHDACVVRDSIEVTQQVNRAADEGAAAIKVYFRLPPQLIKVACEAAHKRGLPVTAHLEITEAKLAIEQGLDGVEHITSFGLSLVPQREGERYRQQVLADNNARKPGRYEMWRKIDPDGAGVDSLADFLVRKGTFVSPTLGAFEYQAGTALVDSTMLLGFGNMKKAVHRLQERGVRIVLGSHSSITYAETGWAYQREMELFAESGISNAAIIVAATMQNARYFRVDDRLGSIEKGKLADLVLVRGNPLQDIRVMRNISRVMLNGKWVTADL